MYKRQVTSIVGPATTAAGGTSTVVVPHFWVAAFAGHRADEALDFCGRNLSILKFRPLFESTRNLMKVEALSLFVDYFYTRKRVNRALVEKARVSRLKKARK